MNHKIEIKTGYAFLVLCIFAFIAQSCQLLQYTLAPGGTSLLINPSSSSSSSSAASNITINTNYIIASAVTNYQISISLLSNVRFDSVEYPSLCIDFTNIYSNYGTPGNADCILYLDSTNNQSNTSLYTLVPVNSNEFVLSNDAVIYTNSSGPGTIVECMDANNKTTSPCAVDLWAQDLSTVQYWELNNISNNIYTVYNVFHGWCLWVSNGTGGTPPYIVSDSIWVGPLYSMAGVNSNAFQWNMNVVSTASNIFTNGVIITNTIIITDVTVITDVDLKKKTM